MDIIEYKRGADTPAIEFAGDMQVFAGAASCGAGNANHITRMNYCPFDDKNFREMTITDGVPTMPQGYILAGSLVLSDLHDHTLHHGHHLVATCAQVQSAMKFTLSRKRVLTVAIRRSDLDIT